MKAYDLVWEALVATALRDRACYARFAHVVDTRVFGDSVLERVYKLLGGFIEKYRRTPNKDEMKTELKRLPASELDRLSRYEQKLDSLYDNPPKLKEDVLVEHVIEGVKMFRLADFLTDASWMADAGKIDYDRLTRLWTELSSLSFDDDGGTEISNDVGSVVAKVMEEERFVPVSTGISTLDESLHGGWFKKQLQCLIGPSGTGKSALLVNHAVGAALQGNSVVLVTNELPEIVVMERIIRRISKMTRTELMESQIEATKFVGRFFRLTNSRIFVKYFPPRTLTVSGLDAYLDRLALDGFNPDIVILDYLDEMKACDIDKRKDTRFQHRGIASALGGMAKQRDVAVLTATQTNRQALGKKVVTEKDIGEDYGKVQVSDVIYAICQTAEEEKAGMCRLRLCKVRDGPGKGREIPVRVNFAKMLVETIAPKAREGVAA